MFAAAEELGWRCCASWWHKLVSESFFFFLSLRLNTIHAAGAQAQQKETKRRKKTLHTSSSVELLELNITIYKKKRYYELLLLCKHQRFGVRVRIRLFGERRKSLIFLILLFSALSLLSHSCMGFLRPHLILTRMAEKCNSKCNAIQKAALCCVCIWGGPGIAGERKH